MGPTAAVLLSHIPDARELQSFRRLVEEESPHLAPSFGTPGTDQDNERPEEDRQEILLRTAFLVRSWYSLVSPTNGRAQHGQLGRACLSVARVAQGMIDFGGALLPPLPDIEPFFSEMVRGIPGIVLTLPCQTANGRTWATHVCDVPFMEAWLIHPRFHMIK